MSQFLCQDLGFSSFPNLEGSEQHFVFQLCSSRRIIHLCLIVLALRSKYRSSHRNTSLVQPWRAEMADERNQESVAGRCVNWNSGLERPSNDSPADLQTTWGDDWEDGPTDQTLYTDEDERQEDMEPRPQARLRTLTATIKGGLRRLLPRFRKYSANDDFDDGWNDQDTGDEAWNDEAWSDDEVFTTTPTTSSRLNKLASNFRGFLGRSVSKLKQRKAHCKDSDWVPAPDPWGFDEQRLAAQASKDTASNPLNFTDPLVPSSHVEAKDFLSRFLSTPRDLNIHPGKKHKLAMFMLRLCREACYEHVKLHAPRALTLLRIVSPDDLELQYWFNILDSLRTEKGIPPARPVKGEHEGYVDGLKTLRNKAEHREDFQSSLIEYLVWHLEKLDDKTRRRQLGDVLEQLYRDECAVAARRLEAQTNVVVGGLDTNQGVVTPSSGAPTHGVVSPNAIPIGSSSDNSSQTAVDNVTTTTASEPPCYTLAVEDSRPITSYNGFLRACQRILEECLFNHLSRTNPEFVAHNNYTAPEQIELSRYDAIYDNGELKFQDADRARVKDCLFGARRLRNAAAHHNPPDWPERLEDESARNGESTARVFNDALELAELASDSDAARAIRLAAWVADVNLREAELATQAVEKGRSREEWEALLHGAEAWLRRLEGRGWWLDETLQDSRGYFFRKLREKEGWDGVETILSRWEGHGGFGLTDPRIEAAWNNA